MGKPVIITHFSDFVILEPEIFIILLIEYGYDSKVVHSGENTLFTDPEAPCNNREIQTGICFQCRLKKRPDKIDHLIIKAA